MVRLKKGTAASETCRSHLHHGLWGFHNEAMRNIIIALRTDHDMTLAPYNRPD